MNPSHKKASLITLGLTSLTLSRAWFALINDPEGPNLLIVIVLAAILFVIARATFKPLSVKWGSLKGVATAIGVQIVVGVLLYMVL